MKPFKRNLTIIQGADFDDDFVWQAGPDEDNLAPVDITGCTARMQVRAEVDSPDVLLSLTTENGGIALGGATGSVVLTLTALQTAAIDWEQGVYDLELVYPDARVRRLMAGRVVVSPEVTR